MLRFFFALTIPLSFAFSLACSHAAADDTSSSISGEVTLAKGVTLKPGGALFVMAKEASRTMPVAVLRIPDPKFPYKFSIGAKNVMMPHTPFTGPYLISARYSPTGDAMDKSGPQGSEAKAVGVGKSDLKIELK